MDLLIVLLIVLLLFGSGGFYLAGVHGLSGVLLIVWLILKVAGRV